MKKALRAEMRRKIAAMDSGDKRRISEAIFLKIEQLPEFETAANILFFWSLPDEVSACEFADKWVRHKCLLLPVVNGDELEIRHYDGSEQLKPGSFGIQEPMGKLFSDFNKIDMILVPGLAFDCSGNRLGRGKGYYDRLLPKLAGVRIGICFPCQLLNHIPHQEWDARMDMVISY